MALASLPPSWCQLLEASMSTAKQEIRTDGQHLSFQMQMSSANKVEAAQKDGVWWRDEETPFCGYRECPW